ncbi:MAG: hypothetical protein KAI17_10405, partial [Thiotrichaceae bacterium]|nr:hypothetical protein [Thiotrichaceae bacterium]
MTTQTKKRGWIFIFLFLILLLGGAIVYSYQLWQEFNASQQKISAKISTLQTELKGLHSQTHDIQRLDKDLTRLTYKIETQPEHDDDWKIA